jgi:phosphatidylglycerol lysyltransferase
MLNIIRCAAALAFLAGVFVHGAGNPSPSLTAQGRRGPIPLYVFRPTGESAPKAIVIFGSGDGGWSGVETRMCQALAGWGCLVLGVDFNKYAKTDFSEEVLTADTAAIVGAAWPDSSKAIPPLILGGWSMGAEVSVPTAAALKGGLKERLAGLLLVAPGGRGRFGLRVADRMGLAPSGDGTFALADYGGRLGSIRVAQFHASRDILDSTSWLRGLTASHRLFTMPKAFHDFGGVSAEFRAMLIEGLAWILDPAAKAGP